MRDIRAGMSGYRSLDLLEINFKERFQHSFRVSLDDGLVVVTEIRVGALSQDDIDEGGIRSPLHTRTESEQTLSVNIG